MKSIIVLVRKLSLSAIGIGGLNKGNFLWKQFAGAIHSGAEMIYVAMFDEIDEATAIFKCAHQVPVGESKFVQIDPELETNHYLWLTGQAKLMLNKILPFSWQQPQRKK
ncbi:MAG: hypothetical protein Q7U47_05160 [Paludibacter sp.]|nr:hypothetical protein [Paludibacter sp.]